MDTADLARAMRELSGLADSSPHRCLRRLVDFVAQAVPGCAGATATLWRGGELDSSAASHPDLAVLLDRQLARGSGPVPHAVRTIGPVRCADTLAELDAADDGRRWPEYAAEALRCGVRCSATLVHDSGNLLVTLTLYGARPKTLDPAAVPLASLLAAVGGVSLANASRYDDSRRAVSQLEKAVTARATVEQAKGLLMNALRCDADAALARLRHLALARHIEVSEAARCLIEEHFPVSGSPRPAPETGPPPQPADRAAV
jgi:hypothetical protein